MAIDTENTKGKEVVAPGEKGKEVVPPLKKGKEVVSPLDDDVVVEEPPSGKRRNYDYHEEAGPTHFGKVILAAKLECLPMPLDFMKHFPAAPQEFNLKTNTGCAWRVTVRVINDRATLDRGCAPFTVVHQIMIGYMVTFKLLTPDTLKVIVFNDDGVEVVTKCKKHDDAFTMNI